MLPQFGHLIILVPPRTFCYCPQYSYDTDSKDKNCYTKACNIFHSFHLLLHRAIVNIRLIAQNTIMNATQPSACRIATKISIITTSLVLWYYYYITLLLICQEVFEKYLQLFFLYKTYHRTHPTCFCTCPKRVSAHCPCKVCFCSVHGILPFGLVFPS